MGTYKTRVQEVLLTEKKEKATQEQKKKLDEEKNKRGGEQRRKVNDLRRQIAQAKRKQEDISALEEEMKAAEEPAEEPAPMEVEVELTDAERSLIHRKTTSPDILDGVVSKAFANFSLPSKEEGFDEVKFLWDGEESSAKILKDWVFAKKLMQRADDIKPGEWFKEQVGAWTKTLQEWRKRTNEWKDPKKKKELL